MLNLKRNKPYVCKSQHKIFARTIKSYKEQNSKWRLQDIGNRVKEEVLRPCLGYVISGVIETFK